MLRIWEKIALHNDRRFGLTATRTKLLNAALVFVPHVSVKEPYWMAHFSVTDQEGFKYLCIFYASEAITNQREKFMLQEKSDFVKTTECR